MGVTFITDVVVDVCVRLWMCVCVCLFDYTSVFFGCVACLCIVYVWMSVCVV